MSRLDEVIAALRASNDALAKSVAGIRTPPPPRPPLCQCGERKRPFALGCAVCASKGGAR